MASSLRLAFCSLLSLSAEAAGDCSSVEQLALCHCAREGLSARAFGQAEPASVSIDVERPGQDFDSEIVGLSSQVSRLKQVRVRGRVAVLDRQHRQHRPVAPASVVRPVLHISPFSGEGCTTPLGTCSPKVPFTSLARQRRVGLRRSQR